MDLDDKFVASFPLFALVNRAIHDKQGLVPAVVEMGSPEFPRMLPLFTDTDLARRVRDGMGKPGIVTAGLQPVAVRAVLTAHQKNGVTHVAVDLDLGPPPRGRFYPIAEVITAIPDA